METLLFEMCYHKTNAHKALTTQGTPPSTNAQKPPKHHLKLFCSPKKKKKRTNSTYKVNCSKASMSNFMQTHEDFLRIIFVEEVSNLWVLWHPFAHGEACQELSVLSSPSQFLPSSTKPFADSSQHLLAKLIFNLLPLHVLLFTLL